MNELKENYFVVDIEELDELEFGEELTSILDKLEFGEELTSILDIFDFEWRNEALDGDEVDILVEHLRNQLNLINGNITRKEYEELEM